jgi:ribosome maturation protein Sdo1
MPSVNPCSVSTIQESFGTTDEEKICLEILTKGELQVRRAAA